MIARRLIPSLAALLLPSTPVLSQDAAPLSPADFLVAEIRDGMDSVSVRRHLGQPDSVSVADNPWEPGAKLTKWSYHELTVTLNAKAIGITLHGRRVSTHRGLHVGDRAARVAKLYGSAGSATDDEWWYRDPADSTGSHLMLVAFERGLVSSVYLGWYTE